MLLLFPLLCCAAGNEPVTTLPSAIPNASSYAQTRTFLQQELPAVLSQYFEQGFVVSGGTHATAAGMVSAAFSTEAYTELGNRVTGNGSGGPTSINYSAVGCDTTDTAWVVISAATGNSLGNFLRVSGSNYFVNCFDSGPSAPANSTWLMQVTLTSGTIAVVSDLRIIDPPLHNPINVLASPYNADNHGVRDSTAAFQAAIDQQRHIYVPAGTYLLGQLVMKSNVTLECEGWDTILRVKNGLNNHFIYNNYAAPAINNVVVRNCQIDGNKTNNTAGSSIVLNGVNILAEHNYIHDPPEACIDMGRPSGANNMRMLDNWCDNPARSGNFFGAFAFTGGSNLHARHNLATTTDHFMGYCLDAEPNSGWTITNVVFQNNICINGNVVATAEGDNRAVTNVLIQNNIINATQVAGGNSGIRAWVLSGKVIISGNIVTADAVTLGGIDAMGINAPIIENNHIIYKGAQNIDNVRMAGIYLDNIGSGIVGGNFVEASLFGNTTACIKEGGTTATVAYGFNVAANCSLYGATTLATFPVQSLPNRFANFATIKLTDFIGLGAVENRVPSSFVFSSGWFIADTMVVTDNAAADPLGNIRAATLNSGAGVNPYIALAITQSTFAGEYYIASVWLQAIGGPGTCRFRLSCDVGGVYGDQIFTVGTAWTRISVSGLVTAVDSVCTMYINENGTGNNWHIFGAQFEHGTQTGPYIQTTGTGVSYDSALAVNGIIVTVP